MATEDLTNSATTTNVRDKVERVTQSAHDAIDQVAAKATPAIEQLQSAASNAAQSLQDKANSLGEMEEVWIESARNCVRDHPLASVLVALAAGMLINRLSS